MLFSLLSPLQMATTFHHIFYRIGKAIDEYSALSMSECRTYDAAAIREEERVDSIKTALSKLANNINPNINSDEGDAVEW